MRKIKNKKEIRNNKGITLVALVITIIILLILAGIAIAQLTDSGLFGKAKLAKQKQENSEAIEEDRLKQYENAINNGEIISDRETVTIPKSEYDMLKNANAYSTTEKVIGTWVNNKPLYQKVINVTSPSSATTWTDVYTVEDAEYLRVLYGELEVNDANVDKLILDHGTTAYMAIKGNKVRMYVASAYTKKNALFLIQYTKTTD